jgi:KUP system potassium uptake protein
MASDSGSHSRSSLPFLALTALGVVYGDIGTSPLYAIRYCFSGAHALPVSHENILGVLSLIFWTLVMVVSLKYVVYVLRADNHGEGGVLALMALATSGTRRKAWIPIALGLFGASLLYGDAMITPAISVLGAMEGLLVVSPALHAFIVPATIAILIALFAVQRRGTAAVGTIFGPIILLWFVTMAYLGLVSILHVPAVLSAVNPVHAVRFFANNGWAGYLVLGTVFLVATGGEALYADLGHFGKRPMKIDWFAIVMPSLLLNYFGQGALLLRTPGAADNPFYRLAPGWALLPLLILATMATVIASQAMISGVFSLTRQAVQLGFAPRMAIVHTSERAAGQIYIPAANWGLMLATVTLVLVFRTSENLAAAYGVAVTTTMLITTLLAFVVARRIWGWSLWVAVPLTAVFLVIDTAYFGANIIKIAHGGWLPLLIGGAVFFVFTTWKRGRDLLASRLAEHAVPAAMVIDDIAGRSLPRARGTAIFLTSETSGAPIALLHNIKHNEVVHQRNIFMTVVTEDLPYVGESERLEISDLGNGFYRMIARFGFMEQPDIPQLLESVSISGQRIDPSRATYILSRENVIRGQRRKMTPLREMLFVFMKRNGRDAAGYFGLPPNRVIELGMQVEMS